jgi:hypothetical protein
MKKPFKNFQMRPTTKGVKVNAEQHGKSQARRTGIFATLANLLRGHGSSAPSTTLTTGTGAPSSDLPSFLAISGNHPGGEEQYRADRRVADERCAEHARTRGLGRKISAADGSARVGAEEMRPVLGKDAGSPHRAAERPRTRERGREISGHDGRVLAGAEERRSAFPTEEAAPRSSVASARARKRAAVGCVAVAMGLFLSATAVPTASAAGAESPWWHLSLGSRPTVLPAEAGEKAEVILTATNLGDAFAAGAADPVRLAATLPAGLTVDSVIGIAGSSESQGNRGPVACVKVPSLVCTFAGTLPPFDPIEVRIAVTISGEGPPPGSLAEATVSGGGALPVSISHPLASGPEATPFGLDGFGLGFEEEGGAPATQAGSHPFQQTVSLAINQEAARINPAQSAYEARPAALPKDVGVDLPRGLIGNPSPFPTCSLAKFLQAPPTNSIDNECKPQTAVGVAVVNFDEPLNLHLYTRAVPIFNIEPGFGEPARFGFMLPGTPVLIDTALRSGPGGDYGITASTTNISQTAALLSSQLTLWGVPGDPRHDNSRGWGCLEASRQVAEPAEACATPPAEPHPPAFLTLPTSCTGPLLSSAEADSWVPDALPVLRQADPLQALDSCNRVPFTPTIESAPTSDAATSPTGLDFHLDVNDEGLLNSNPESIAQSEIKKAVVTLPEGFTTNPSVAEGLKACGLAEFEAATVAPGTGCTPESKIGSVQIESPLVSQKVEGSLYVARQRENPFGSLLALYMIARNPELGVLVRSAGKVEPNPVTGQLTTTFDEIPQLPFSHFQLSFRQGQRSPLVTPPTCGTYTVKADLYPYSNPTEARHEQSSFQITQGPEGQGCPNGTPPFHPVLEAGSLNPTAGTYSPFTTKITRKDSEQEITRFSIKLPTGLLAKLKGVSECSDAQIATAKSREGEGGGTIEQEHPSCPSGSEIGHSLVGSGVGNVLAYAPGKLYLAGPYHGSPISIVSVTAAKVGPFDLGTVVVRFALDVNHETAEVSVDGAASDPIPHIVDGIPIHLRDIRAYVDRPGFALNPTSCAKKSTAATVLGSGANFVSSSDDVPVTVSSPFQAADCASLGFAPKLALNLTGKKTHRGALPALKAVLTYPKGGAYANIAKAQVTLPGSEFLEQGHLKNVCTRKVFETGATPGENCPKNSIYGKARAVTPLLEAPLEGPVYLRTGYGTRLPELAAALNGPQISITLAGTIDSVHQKGTEGSRIRNTFALVPDAPVEKFVLELKGGNKGLLVNSTDVCKGTHKALAAFTGQNGKLDEYEPALKAQCGKGAKKGKKSGKKKNGGGKGKGSK